MVAKAESITWSSASDEGEFNRILIIMLVLAGLLTLAIPAIQLPEVVRNVVEQLPPQFAEIILDKPEDPVPEPVTEPEPAPEIVKVEPITEPAPEQAIVAPVPQTVKQAREKASLAGILAFRDDLMEMREAIDASTLKDTASVQRGIFDAASVDRSLITSANSSRQANVNITELSRETGGVALASRQTTVVEAPIEEEALKTGAVRLVQRPDLTKRSIEKIRRVFDANKGAIYAIYNRALRTNPDLLGKVVLELVIEPDGTVSDCRVVSTDLEDEEMVAKLVRRVQMFDFGGEENVTVTKIEYPVHFLPS